MTTLRTTLAVISGN